MANTTLTLLAAGSLRSAFLPLVAHFRQHTGGGRCAVWPCRCCASGSKPGHLARFCFRQRGAPAGAAAGGSGAGMPGFASNQLMLTARRSPDNDGWTGWRCSARPPAVGDLHAGLRSVGRLYRQLFARIEARYPGLGNAMAGRAQQLVGGRDSLSVPPGEIAGRGLFARIWRICLSAMRTMAPRWPPATICVP